MSATFRAAAAAPAADFPGSAFPGGASPADFCRHWLALQCAEVGGVQAALLLLREEDGSAFATAALWPSPKTALTALAPAAQECLATRRRVLLRPPGGPLLACPLDSDEGLHGALVLHLDERSADALARAERQIQWGSGWLDSHLRRREGEAGRRSLARARSALDVFGVAAEAQGLTELGLAVVNDLASRCGCERVAFGIARGGRVRLLALSHSAFFEQKSQLVAALENAMDEALDQRCSLCWPPAEEGEGGAAPGVAFAHRELAAGRALCSVPLSSGGAGLGVLTFERGADERFVPEEIRGLAAIAGLLAPLLARQLALERWFAGRAAERLAQSWRHLRDPRRPAFRLGLLAGLLALVSLFVIDGDYRISAKSVVEGEVQRAVVAPFDGFIREAPLRAGMRVHQGQLLALLDERDLLLEQQRWAAERLQHERRYRDALARHERAGAQVSLAQIGEADAQLALVDERIGRARVLAPFDGILVSGDLSQLLGAPVEQGKLLFEVAPLDAYRLILKVDERDIRHVQAGAAGRLVLTGLAGEALDFTVHSIAMAQAEEGRNLFRVEAKLLRHDVALRPGMEGVGKIHVGERSWAWIWTHPLLDWLRLVAWTWLP